MESGKLCWLTDKSYSSAVLDLERFRNIELLTVCGIDELMPHIGRTSCILASVPLSQMELESLAPVPVIFWLDRFAATEVVRMVRAGAFHCFDGTASIDEIHDAVAAAIKHSNSRTAGHRQAYQEEWRASLVGESTPMKTVAETIRLIATRKCTVLISGETGTGKEVVARAIHMASQRAHLPMISVNCAALPENLLEAELFGHTRGAFTGATSHRIGRFEQANKSTLFLDEIGDMPLELQAKLLRVLQDREFQRLGSSETMRVDVRIIAASNVDLVERVRSGKFRADLYYRLNVVPLALPALRARKGDIPALVRHFVAKVCRTENIVLKSVAPGALDSLCSQQWPGNIRQLENTIEMAIALSGDREILVSRDFGLQPVVARASDSETPAPELMPFSQTANFDTAILQFQLSLLNWAMRESAGNKTVAAERLGLKRTTLVMKLKHLENARISSEDTEMPLMRIPAAVEVGGSGAVRVRSAGN